jgi:hypothetical protein
MKCDWCESSFSPARSWQRFCCPKCRDDWNNREKKRAAVEAAEERREDRINGHANGGAREEKIDLAQLGLASKAEPLKRRRI